MPKPYAAADPADPKVPPFRLRPALVEPLPQAMVPTEVATLLPDAIFGVLAASQTGEAPHDGNASPRHHRYEALFVVEVQLSRDPNKPWRWDHYGAALSDLHRVPAHVVVVAPRARIYHWIKRSLALHAKRTGRPVPIVLLGPEHFERLAAHPAVGSFPALAALSALAFAADGATSPEAARKLTEAVAQAVKATWTLPEDELQWYFQVLSTHTPAGLITITKDEVFMSFEGQKMTLLDIVQLLERAKVARAEGNAEGKAEGMAEGEARGEARGKARGRLLTLLEVRGLVLTPAQAERVQAETEVAVLQRWADRAKVVARADDVFADG